MPKIKGNGKASIWTDDDLAKLLQTDLIRTHPERILLIALLRYTGERIGAVLQLQVEDCYQSGKPRTEILFRKSTRKGKVSSHEVPTCQKLADHLRNFTPPTHGGYLFESPIKPDQPLSYGNCHRWLNLALGKAGLKSSGYAWHSFRRTFATVLSKRLPLTDLQKLTGHKSLDVLKEYIEIDKNAIVKALESL